MPAPPADADVIRLWLETNLTEAMGKGTQAVEELRAKVQEMGPEVSSVFDDLTRAEIKVAQAGEEVAKVSSRLGDSLTGMGVVVKEAGKAAEEAIGDEESGKGFAGLAGGILKAEKAGTALVTGHGLARVGPMLESITLALGGPAGLGLALGALAFALEGILPKLTKFFDAWDTEKLKAIAESMKKLTDEADRLSKIPTTAEEQITTGVSAFLKEQPQAEVRASLVAAVTRQRVGTQEERIRQLRAQAEQDVILHPERVGQAYEEINRIQRGLPAVRTDAEREALEIFTTLRTSAAARGQAQTLAERFPEEFAAIPEFAGGILQFEPRATRQQEQNIREAEEFGDRARRAGERRRERARTINETRREAQQQYERQARASQFNSEEEEQERRKRDQEDKAAADFRAMVERQAQQAQREANRKAREAEQERKRLDRENDPSNVLRRQQQALEDQMTIFAGQANEQFGFARTPGQLQQVIRDALNQLPRTGGNFGAAVQAAVQAGYMKATMDRQRDIHRLQVFSESMMNP